MIYNAEPLGFSQAARAKWETLGNYVEGTIDDKTLAGERAQAEILIVRLARRIDASVLCHFPMLRWIVSATTGLDHLDLVMLKARKIKLISLRGEIEFLNDIPSTAEHTMALLLALLRRLPAAVTSVIQGDWERDRFRGRQLKGRKLGIVGLGRTGRMVANYAHAFGAVVVYVDPQVDDRNWARKDSLSDVLRECEIISLHVHLNDSTRHMIGANELAQMPKGAYLINTSRGALIDEFALVDRLRSGHIAGVAVDVLANEIHGVHQSALWQGMLEGLPVIVTPHIGGATQDAMHQCEEYIVDKFLKSYRSEFPG